MLTKSGTWIGKPAVLTPFHLVTGFRLHSRNAVTRRDESVSDSHSSRGDVAFVFSSGGT